MFDGLKNMAALPGLMAKAREMQGRMQEMQEGLARRQVSADAGGGMVEATVNGKMELVRLKIDKTRVDLADTDLLEDLVVAAVNAAQAKAGDMVREETQKLAGDLGLPPGMMQG